ncbi:CehA/McbA family metallohydrolase [Cohnella zeiphila]|uniref:CehA/McbA family metallohydrolase n=1 Tax=Cohnella zeiphila TaxID=2761120 RepID=A0A7X0SNQ8_9BACL|nr:CehA/McbA family metallohydrolase [Cohnella zeiphila]MBB6733291.1 CehA/McbA family metallohydrolase [Cohnella zeiphila]
MKEVYPKDNSGQEALLLSAGKTATAEHELEGCEAGKAIDGRTDTCWAGAPYYKWWKLDLGRICDIERIVIGTTAGADGYSHYYIECSPDDLNWETVVEKADGMVSPEGGDRYDDSFAARYVRVTVTYCSSGEVARIRRFEAYGRPRGAGRAEEDSKGKIGTGMESASPQGAQGVQPKITPSKFFALDFDESSGFEETVVDDIEPGQRDRVLAGGEAGSYLIYRGVDFTEVGVNQLRGQFGFADLDKSKRVTLEVRAGGPDGERIGELVLFKQWKRWSILAGRLEHDDPRMLTGVHDICLVVTEASPGQQLMIHWLAFVKRAPLPSPRPRPAALPAPANGQYQIFFGNLHSHTGFSDGIGVPEYAYDYARYTAGLDFLAITEHSNLYDHYLDWEKSRKWADIRRTADRKTENGAFLALFGAETTWYNQFGHMNTYNMDFFINAYETQYNDIPTYYETVKQYPDSIQQWNHPWSCGDRHLDGFAPYDAELDEVLHMLEINTIESKELGGLYYYIKALDNGWHVAPVGSQDNHHGQWGTENTLRTAILVEELTREHFYDAVRHQRVYFTSALHLKVWFKVNGAVMGSRIPQADSLDIEIKALFGVDTGNRIVKAELIGERGEVLHTIRHDGKTLECFVRLPGGQRYLLAKVYQEDGEFAATAPVWLESK